MTRVLALADAADGRLVGQVLGAGVAAFLVNGEYTTEELVGPVVAATPERAHLSCSARRGFASVAGASPVPPTAARPTPAGCRALLSHREGQVMDQSAGCSTPSLGDGSQVHPGGEALWPGQAAGQRGSVGLTARVAWVWFLVGAGVVGATGRMKRIRLVAHREIAGVPPQ